MAKLIGRTGRLTLVLASALGLWTSASAQTPPPPAQQPSPAQQQASALGSANQFEPGPLGQPRPNVGPDPMPQIRRSTDCPLGYVAVRDKQYVAHLTVCVVRPPNQQLLNNVAGPGPAPTGQPISSMPPILERTAINLCIGRPAGSYACGRGGTECCGPKQNNMCFAGAFACYVNGVGTGPKTACCISK